MTSERQRRTEHRHGCRSIGHRRGCRLIGCDGTASAPRWSDSTSGCRRAAAGSSHDRAQEPRERCRTCMTPLLSLGNQESHTSMGLHVRAERQSRATLRHAISDEYGTAERPSQWGAFRLSVVLRESLSRLGTAESRECRRGKETSRLTASRSPICQLDRAARRVERVGMRTGRPKLPSETKRSTHLTVRLCADEKELIERAARGQEPSVWARHALLAVARLEIVTEKHTGEFRADVTAPASHRRRTRERGASSSASMRAEPRRIHAGDDGCLGTRRRGP